MIVRIFLSSVAPGDVEEVVQLFKEDVVPVFESIPECLGIELVMAPQTNVAGLLEGGAISRWKSIEAMNEALLTPEVQRSQARLRELLRREPIQKVFEVRT